MHQPELRAEPRVAVNLGGVLTLGDAAVPCHIRNMCGNGFLIQSGKGLPVGRAVRLTCEPYPGRFVECTVDVRHVNADCLGARVIEISEEDLRLCRQFLAERHAAAREDAARH